MSFDNDGELTDFEMFNVRAKVSIRVYNELQREVCTHADFARFEALKTRLHAGTYWTHREDRRLELNAITTEYGALWVRLFRLTYDAVMKAIAE